MRLGTTYFAQDKMLRGAKYRTKFSFTPTIKKQLMKYIEFNNIDISKIKDIELYYTNNCKKIDNWRA